MANLIAVLICTGVFTKLICRRKEECMSLLNTQRSATLIELNYTVIAYAMCLYSIDDNMCTLGNRRNMEANCCGN